jgi:hypothetical protein
MIRSELLRAGERNWNTHARDGDHAGRSLARAPARAQTLRLTTIAAVVALALPPSARAASGAALSPPPSITGQLGGEATLHINVVNTNTLGGIPAPATAFVVHLPAGLTFAHTGFALCPLAKVPAGACPNGSQVGSGTSHVQASIGGILVNETAAIKIYVARVGPLTLAFWADGIRPVQESLVFSATITPDSPPFSDKATGTLPTITTVPGGPDGSIVSFSVTVGARRTTRVTRRVVRLVRGKRKTVTTRFTSTVNAITLPRTCAASTLQWGFDESFQDGSTSSATATSPCP